MPLWEALGALRASGLPAPGEVEELRRSSTSPVTRRQFMSPDEVRAEQEQERAKRSGARAPAISAEQFKQFVESVQRRP